MNPLERADNAPDEFAQHLADQRRRMHEAHAFVMYAHSRSGLLARFLQAMTDRIDPTGDARRGMR